VERREEQVVSLLAGSREFCGFGGGGSKSERNYRGDEASIGGGVGLGKIINSKFYITNGIYDIRMTNDKL